MTILSASTEEREGFPPFLKPSECYETGMKELVRNHSLQLSPASKELVNLEAEENRIVFHFGLLLFDGDVERARELVKGECKLKEGGDDVPKSSSNASKSVDDVLKVYPKIKIEESDFSEQYSRIKLSKSIALINPLLYKILGNPCIVEVERIVPRDE